MQSLPSAIAITRLRELEVLRRERAAGTDVRTPQPRVLGPAKGESWRPYVPHGDGRLPPDGTTLRDEQRRSTTMPEPWYEHALQRKRVLRLRRVEEALRAPPHMPDDLSAKLAAIDNTDDALAAVDPPRSSRTGLTQGKPPADADANVELALGHTEEGTRVIEMLPASLTFTATDGNLADALARVPSSVPTTARTRSTQSRSLATLLGNRTAVTKVLGQRNNADSRTNAALRARARHQPRPRPTRIAGTAGSLLRSPSGPPRRRLPSQSSRHPASAQLINARFRAPPTMRPADL